MVKPKRYIDNDRELEALTVEWKNRLGLNDWLIAVSLCKQSDMTSIDYAGQNTVDWVGKTAEIQLLDKGCMPDTIFRQPQELVLIHELLHCVLYQRFDAEGTGIEVLTHDMMTHSNIERLAKALYMAKYNITLDWFKEEW